MSALETFIHPLSVNGSVTKQNYSFRKFIHGHSAVIRITLAFAENVTNPLTIL